MTQTENQDVAPEWFNDAFIENALKKGLKVDDLKVLEKEINLAALPGDHYASTMFRCNLKIRSQKFENKTKNLSVIVKVILPGVMGEELRKFSAFEKEAEVLSVTFPAISEILKKIYPDEEKLAPDCYYHEGSPNNLIMMEDLKVHNFTIANRMEGLDMNHATLVLRALGKYHAASLALKEKDPDSMELYKIQIWCKKNKEMTNNFMIPVLSALSEDILSWEDLDRRQVFHEKLEILKSELTDRVLEIMEEESGLKVLLHGDSWVNNFMFRYDSSGKPVQMKFVDFQLACLNSPAVDLVYFIFSSTREDLKFTQTETFLKIYHDSFVETLKRLNLTLPEPYEFEDLKRDFEKRQVWGLLVFCCIFPLFKVPSGETMTSDELIRGEKNRFQSIFQRKNVRKAMSKGLMYFEEKGVL